MKNPTAGSRSGRLPAEITSFVGRERELAELRRLIGQARLITLAGPGGVGKTRLALRFAAEAPRSFPDGIWFVDLAALREPVLLAHTVGEALALPDQSAEDQLDALADFVANRQMLLVLDTCEHLVDACAMLAEVLLRAAPKLRVLATSRQPLNVVGEHTVMVAPLGRPTPETAQPCESVSLFADRAAAVVAGWTVTPANQAAVATLCQRLDGIPLAIELAAAQLRALSVEQILDRLDNRLLQIRGRRGQQRHQTLRAAMAWSHELCSPEERLLWARLSVFAGDFTLEAAEQVCSDPVAAEGALSGDDVLDLLTGLVEKSVVVRVEDSGEARYHMLDTLREFGTELLAELGQQEVMRARHLDWFIALALRAQAELTTSAQPRWLAALRRDHANLRAALEYALHDDSDGETACRLALALGRFWILQGMIGQARLWVERTLATVSVTGPLRTELLAGNAVLAVLQNDLAAARPLTAQARELATASHDLSGLGYVLAVEGIAALYADELDQALPLLEESARLHSEGASSDVLTLLDDVFAGAVSALRGEFDRAAAHCDQIMSRCDAEGEVWCRAYAIGIRAMATWLQGDPEAALADTRVSLKAAMEIDNRLGMTLAFDLTGLCLIGMGDPVGGTRLMAAVDRLLPSLGASLFGPQHKRLRELCRAQAEEMLGPDEAAAAKAEGTMLDLDAAISLALGTRPEAPEAEPLDAPGPLTRRENEIAELVAQGLSNREIAERLFIAKRTVDSHVEHILSKLDINSRTQIAVWVTERH